MMGWKEWIIGWAKKKLLSHYSHHKEEVHRLTDIVIKEGSKDVVDELVKQGKIPSQSAQLINTYLPVITDYLDSKVDAAIDKWVEQQLGEGK